MMVCMQEQKSTHLNWIVRGTPSLWWPLPLSHLFYLEGRKAVPRHVYDIVISGEDADVPILVPNTDVHCVVVALS